MKNKTTFSTLRVVFLFGALSLTFLAFAQKAETRICENLEPFCSTDIITYPSLPGNALTGTETCFYCLSSGLNAPTWFFMQVENSGKIVLEMTNPQGVDIDFVLWGPFNSPSEACELIDEASPGNCDQIPEEDCSWSPDPTETVTINNGISGEVYVLLITNWGNQYCDITVQQIEQPGSSGSLDCDMVFNCSVVAITTNPTACELETGTYDLSGNIDFTNAPETGQLIVEEMETGTQVAFDPPFTTPALYIIEDIPCSNETHHIKAWFTSAPDCELEVAYETPALQCPAGIVISDENPICYNGTNPGIVKLTIFGGITPYTFKWSKDGVQTTVADYPGPFPYEITTTTSGDFVLDTVWDRNCGGEHSDTLKMIIKEAPSANAIRFH